MISLCGTVWGQRYGSYLYAIISDEHIYFGETGDIPPARWGAHLGCAGSSFAEKLRIEFSGHTLSTGEIVFIGLYCDMVDEIEDSKRKIARRAIEEELHRQFLLKKNTLPVPKILLSTPPPPVVRHRFPFNVEIVAEKAFDLVVKEYKAWLLRQSRFCT